MWMSKDDLQELVLSTHHVGSRDWTQQDGFMTILPAHGDTFLLVFFVWDLTLIGSWFSFFTWNWFPWTWGSFVWLHRLSTPHSVVWQWAWPYSGISLETSWLSSLSHFYPDSALLLGTLFCSDFIWSLRISSCWATSAQRYPWLIFSLFLILRWWSHGHPLFNFLHGTHCFWVQKHSVRIIPGFRW